MSEVTFKGEPVQTVGELPESGTEAPPFSLTRTDLSDVSLADFAGKTILLNIFPSIDTPVCAASVRRFNAEAAGFADTVVLCVSVDLPFAHGRFCEAEGLTDVVTLSAFRSQDFGEMYGVRITTGPLRGLLARAIVIIDKSGTVSYTEQVREISQEPDYDAALRGLKR